jgi:hypothetical protein
MELNRSAEDEVLCRGVRCPRKPQLSLPEVTRTGVQRTKSFAGVWGVPTKTYLFLSPPQAANQKTFNNYQIDQME